MKKKVIGRIIAMILTLATLASSFAFWAVADDATEPIVYVSEDFSAAEADGDTLDLESVKLTDTHTYTSIGEDGTRGKYALIPYRGEKDDGNWDNCMRLEHRALSAEDDGGVILEFELYLNFIVPEDVEPEDAVSPTVEFQLGSITHDPNAAGKTTSSYITLLKIDVRTGALMNNAGTIQEGVAGIKPGQWNKIQIELDLVGGTYTTLVGGQKYATYGKFAGNELLHNVNIRRNSILLAKCNKNEGAYVYDDLLSDEEITNVRIDNIKLSKKTDYVKPVEEEKPAYAIFSDTFESKAEGEKPKQFMTPYRSAPNTARVVKDPTGEANNALQVDFKGSGAAPYYFWQSSNDKATAINADECTVADGKITVESYGVTEAPIWGDDDAEKADKPSTGAVTSSKLDSSKTWYVVTGEWCDAMYGSFNVGAPFSPSHPALAASQYETVILNVDYFFSEDAVGPIEIQLNVTMQWNYLDENGDLVMDESDPENPKPKVGTQANVWLDTVVITAKEGKEDLVVDKGSNNKLVSGKAPVLKKGEWFTMSAVIDLTTGYEDIYFNGSYSYTLRLPQQDELKTPLPEGATNYTVKEIQASSLSVGKIQRGRYSTASYLNGFFCVDNINFSTKEALLSSTYDKAQVWNFEDLLSQDGTSYAYEDGIFAENAPNTLTAVREDNDHSIALRYGIGETVTNPNKLVLWSKSQHFAKKAAVTVQEVEYDAEGRPIKVKVANAWKEGERSKFDIGDTDGFKGYELGTYGEYVNYWCRTNQSPTPLTLKDTDITPATSLNRNWTFYNSGISFATRDRLAIHMDLLISEDAAGVVQGRVASGIGFEGDATQKAELQNITLYTIDTKTGDIYIGADMEADPVGKLEKGDWTSFVCVLNMKTGAVEVYSDYIYAGEGKIPYRELSFYERQLVPLTTASGQSETGGNILLDDLRFLTVSKELITVDSTLENIRDITFEGISLGEEGCRIKDGTRLFVVDDTPFEELYYETEAYKDVIKGAYNDNPRYTVRLGDHHGLRFTSVVDMEILEQMMEEHQGKVTYGTLITTAGALEQIDSFTRTNLERSNLKYIDVRTDGFYENFYYDEDEDKRYDETQKQVFAGSVVDLAPDEAAGKLSDDVLTNFAAIGYVEIQLEDGYVVIYSEDIAILNLAFEAQKYLDKVDDVGYANTVRLKNYARKLINAQ